MSKCKHVLRFVNEEFVREEYEHDGLYLDLIRRMRTVPFEGMKQPTPHGAVIGLELVISAKDRGYPAVGYEWFVTHKGTVQCKGRIGNDGSCIIPMPLPVGTPERLVLEVWRPGRARRGPSCARRRNLTAKPAAKPASGLKKKKGQRRQSAGG